MKDVEMLYDAYFAAEEARKIACAAYYIANDVAEKAEAIWDDAVRANDSARDCYECAEIAFRDADNGCIASLSVLRERGRNVTAAEESFDFAKETYRTACKIAFDASKAYQLALETDPL